MALSVSFARIDVVHRTDVSDPGTESVLTVQEDLPTANIASLAEREGLSFFVARSSIPVGFVMEIRLVTSDSEQAVLDLSGEVVVAQIPGGSDPGLRIVSSDTPFEIVEFETTTVLAQLEPGNVTPCDDERDGSDPDSGRGNNGHGNNDDGVDSSNPGQGGGGPNGQDDPSCTGASCDDDESNRGNGGGRGNNGHGNNDDGVDSSNPGQGGGGPNGAEDRCDETAELLFDSEIVGRVVAPGTFEVVDPVTPGTDLEQLPPDFDEQQEVENLELFISDRLFMVERDQVETIVRGKVTNLVPLPVIEPDGRCRIATEATMDVDRSFITSVGSDVVFLMNGGALPEGVLEPVGCPRLTIRSLDARLEIGRELQAVLYPTERSGVAVLLLYGGERGVTPMDLPPGPLRDAAREVLIQTEAIHGP